MEIIIDTKRRKESAVIKEIKKNRSKFKKIQHIDKYYEYGTPSSYVLVTYDDDHLLSDEGVKNLERKYSQLKNVVNVTVNQATDAFKENISTKNCHFVFDVDSTLTSGKGTIQNKIRNIFQNMNEDGYRVYLASGRNMDQLRVDIQDFSTEPYGIAENGGIILGFGKEGYLKIGNRNQPDKVLEFMKNKCKKVKEDIKQGMRLTERIFLATITEPKFMDYVKKSKAKVKVLASKNSYHVTNDKVDKGFALEKLKTKLEFGSNDVVIGVGDSDLDIPLLKESDYRFVVGNASQKAKNVAVNLGKSYADGIQEMYEKWFKK